MRIDSLTFFRFLAASIVVIFHYGKNTALANIAPGFLTAGPEMVSFFFVLSGFVMMIAYWDREFDTARYFQARLVRIVPTYYLAFVAALFLETVAFGKRAVVFNALFLQAWFPPYPLSINGPSWSLSVEMFLYLSFPMILWMLKPKRISSHTLFGIAFFLWFFSQFVLMNLLNSSFYKPAPSIPSDLIFYFPLSHFSTFFLGVAGGYFYLNRKHQRIQHDWLLKLAILATCISIFLTISFEGKFVNLLGMQIPFAAGTFTPLFLALILLVSLAQDTFQANWFKHRFFSLLGDASYALYIFQRPFHQFFDAYVFPFLKLPGDLAFYFYFSCLILFSIGVFLFFEKPLKRLLRPKSIDYKLIKPA